MPKVAEAKKSAQWLANPDCWHYWPLVPLKRRSVPDEMGFPQLGVYVDPSVQAGKHAVHEINLLEVCGCKNPLSEGLAQAKQKFTYASIDELLEDGWEVD
jgi:hypothetical protein